MRGQATACPLLSSRSAFVSRHSVPRGRRGAGRLIPCLRPIRWCEQGESSSAYLRDRRLTIRRGRPPGPRPERALTPGPLRPGSVRFQGADGEGRGAPNGLTAYAAAISLTRACQRATNSRRYSGSGTWAPPRQRIRKYCRSSSNAAQNRAADSKRPKPSIG